MVVVYATILVIYIALLLPANIWPMRRLISTGKNYPSQSAILFWGSPIALISLWGILVSTGAIGIRIPAPENVLRAFLDLIVNGSLISEAGISLGRILIGFGLASLIGVPLGMLAGSYTTAHSLIVPVNSFLRYIPPTAFISLLIVYFGLGESYKYAAIFLGVVFFIVQMTIDVVENVDAHYIDMARTSGFNNANVFWCVTAPASWPGIIDVLRINLGAAWTFLVAAELIGAERGLGHLIQVSQRFSRLDDLYAGILTFGIIGLTTDSLISGISRGLLKWSYLERKR